MSRTRETATDEPKRPRPITTTGPVFCVTQRWVSPRVAGSGGKSCLQGESCCHGDRPNASQEHQDHEHELLDAGMADVIPVVSPAVANAEIDSKTTASAAKSVSTRSAGSPRQRAQRPATQR